MKYTWDLNRIALNLNEARKKAPHYYDGLFDVYSYGMKNFITNIDEKIVPFKTDENFLMKHASNQIKDVKNINNKNMLQRFIKLNFMKNSHSTNIVNHDFYIEEVLDVTRSFLYDITYNVGDYFDVLLDERRVALNKSISNKGKFIRDNFNDSSYIGVNAINKEQMICILVHEFAHAYTNKITNKCNTETLPILFELYLDDYISKEYPKLNSSSFIQERFINDRNLNLDAVKTFEEISHMEFYRAIVPTLRAIEDRLSFVPDFELSLSYLISIEKGLDIFINGDSKYIETNNLLEQEKYVYNINDLLNSSNSKTMCNNENKIKKLVRS